MAANYDLMPNEAILLKQNSVAHGGVLSAYIHELVLTNKNLIFVNKGVLGNIKGIYKYPLNQIKMFNGMPQAIMGKLGNGTASLVVYFINGQTEVFYFDGFNKTIIKKWIKAIRNTVGSDEESLHTYDDSNTVSEAIKGLGNQINGLKNSFISTVEEKSNITIPPLPSFVGKGNQITKKCISCSAPLTGIKGQKVRCKYCDTDQVL